LLRSISGGKEMKDDIDFWVFMFFFSLIFLGGFGFGYFAGTKDACASTQAEWRDEKCVMVAVEEVK
jgi:hypothetical protein